MATITGYASQQRPAERQRPVHRSHAVFTESRTFSLCQSEHPAGLAKAITGSHNKPCSIRSFTVLGSAAQKYYAYNT